MERRTIQGQTYLIGYHTQEFRKDQMKLNEPIQCKGKNAWLGVGYYFWCELEFAQYWGEDFKMDKTGFYDIYEAFLNCENCINAVFDEEGYYFFRDKIEETFEECS
jgi:hypothetical protein